MWEDGLHLTYAFTLTYTWAVIVRWHETMSLFEEPKRRKVFKVGAAYLVVAWLVVQAASIGVSGLRLPTRGADRARMCLSTLNRQIK